MSTTTMNRPVSATERAPLEAPTGIPFARLLRVEWGKDGHGSATLEIRAEGDAPEKTVKPAGRTDCP